MTELEEECFKNVENYGQTKPVLRPMGSLVKTAWPMSAVKKILIVEDDLDIRESIAELLEAEGYVIGKAVNGQDGLEYLAADEQLPCVIFLDLMMPVKDGYEFRKAQLADSRLRDIPVVIMTADANARKRPETKAAQGFIHKPLEVDVLLDFARRLSNGVSGR